MLSLPYSMVELSFIKDGKNKMQELNVRTQILQELNFCNKCKNLTFYSCFMLDNLLTKFVNPLTKLYADVRSQNRSKMHADPLHVLKIC